MLVPMQCAALYNSKHEFVIKYLLFFCFFLQIFYLGRGIRLVLGLYGIYYGSLQRVPLVFLLLLSQVTRINVTQLLKTSNQ